MSRSARTDAVGLHPVEVDLLCALAEVDAPFPLDVPSIGVTDHERRLMFGAARAQLAERGLADDDGPLGVADEFVRMLRASTSVIDLVLAAGSATLGAAVLVDGGQAVLAVQRPDLPGRIVTLRALSLDEAVVELFALVPRVDSATVPPFRLPLPPIRRAFTALTARHEDGAPLPRTPLPVADLDDLLFECGIDGPIGQRMISNLRSVTGSGQTGVAQRSGPTRDWRRVGDEVRWIDTARGRFRLIGEDDGDWVSVNPFSPNDLRSVLRTKAARVRT